MEQNVIKTKWFSMVDMSVQEAGILFLFVAVFALTALAFWEHSLRASEHDVIINLLNRSTNEVTCIVKLNLFVSNKPRGEPIDWRAVPSDLYPCVPKFLYDDRRN